MPSRETVNTDQIVDASTCPLYVIGHNCRAGPPTVIEATSAAAAAVAPARSRLSFFAGAATTRTRAVRTTPAPHTAPAASATPEDAVTQTGTCRHV